MRGKSSGIHDVIPYVCYVRRGYISEDDGYDEEKEETETNEERESDAVRGMCRSSLGESVTD